MIQLINKQKLFNYIIICIFVYVIIINFILINYNSLTIFFYYNNLQPNILSSIIFIDFSLLLDIPSKVT